MVEVAIGQAWHLDICDKKVELTTYAYSNPEDPCS